MDDSPPHGVGADRIIRLISEANTRRDYLYRTLIGTKNISSVILKLERLPVLQGIVKSRRQKTLELFKESYILSMIGTSSVNGELLKLINQTHIRHTTETQESKKSLGSMFGGN